MAKRETPTRKALIEALDEIANYTIPSFPIEGRGPMVELSLVVYLRGLARAALGREDD